MIILLNNLKATCPHCQHRFWQLKEVNGIKFCPQCHCSIYKAASVKRRLFDNDEVLNGAALFIAVYLLLQDNNTQSQLLFSTIFDFLILSIGVFLAVLIINRLICTTFTFFKHNYEPGVDRYDEVQADLRGYIKNSAQDESNKVVLCPSCRSQRLQPITLVRSSARNRAEGSVSSAASKNNKGSGDIRCLNCRTCYQSHHPKPSYYFLVLMYMPALLLGSISFFNIDAFIFNQLPLALSKHDQYLLLACIIGAVVYVMALAFNYYQQYRQSDLRVVKDSETVQ